MSIFGYIFGPKLYKEYKKQSGLYEPVGPEKWGDQILSTLNIMYNISYYSSPVLLTFLYRRGYFDLKVIASFDKVAMGLCMIIAIAFGMRGFGRKRSQAYKRFFSCFQSLKANPKNEEFQDAIAEFDFEFKHWPIDWSMKGQRTPKVHPNTVLSICKEQPLGIVQIPYDMLAFLAIHTFGLKMIYPGSLGLLHSHFHPMLVEGRQRLVLEHRAVRRKLQTVDDNEIETMFVDNRAHSNVNGRTLVICSEGNAGFYEIGIGSTPLELDFSVLGWNHPGFGGSTGQPFPLQDQNAMDAVISYAMEELNFSVQDIVLFGWSIGGYSTVYGAVRFPVKGVILDASFDDIVPLAVPRMPTSISGIVRHAVRTHVNLNISELLKQYHGPVFIIRRTEDEVISEDMKMSTNRGNYLLLNLLTFRFPNIFGEKQIEHIMNKLRQPVDATDSDDHQGEDKSVLMKIAAYISENNQSNYPLLIGENYSEPQRLEMADYLLRKHFEDYNSSHCTPLPSELFRLPWELPNESDFVFT